MPEIVVSGNANRRLLADRADLVVSASFVEPSREKAMAAATAEHERVIERAKVLIEQGSARRYIAEPIGTFSNSWRDDSGQRVTEHHASVRISIELADLGVVGTLVAELAESGVDVRVDWRLDDEHRREVQRELRGEAVASARAAAEDYSAAISAEGQRGVRVMRLRDTGVQASPFPVARMAMAAERVAPEVTVHEIEVSVDVEATFETM